MKRRRLAIVVQRYGEEVNGGAERAARNLAERLARDNDVHVLTTCAREYTTWANVYPPGKEELNGVRVHRFTVDAPREWEPSQQDTGRLLQSERTLDEEIAWIRRQGPFSTSLLQTIKGEGAAYDYFIFFTYLYATTYFGLPLVANKAILVPTAHDEPFLYMPAYRPLFHMPRHLVYLTHAEKEIVQHVTGNGERPASVIGLGIDMPRAAQPDRFRARYNVQGDFILYSGRITAAKNVPQLLEQFQAYHASSGRPVQLLLTGRSNIPIPSHPAIRALGFIPEQDKQDAISAASAIVVPSLYESLSIIALEAWAAGTPVLVNGRCEVLKQQCRRSHGGLYYLSDAEFQAALNRLLADAHLRRQLGKQGRAFVRATYHWPQVTAAYNALFARFSNQGRDTVGT